MKTLLLALISPGKCHGTREGAIRGLVGVGKEAVRKGLVEGGGAKVVAAECGGAERGGDPSSWNLINSVVVRRSFLFPSPDGPIDSHIFRTLYGCSTLHRIWQIRWIH